MHQPEAVAADMVHVRIDGGDRRCHRNHGLERVAAFRQHGAPGLHRSRMGCAANSAAMSGG